MALADIVAVDPFRDVVTVVAAAVFVQVVHAREAVGALALAPGPRAVDELLIVG
jgi:hypothetical protein